MQSCQGQAEENLPHALVYCQANDRVGMKLYECLREIQPNLQVEAVLRLELEVEDELELPVVWLIGCVLGILWNFRQQSNSKVKGYQVRSQLEAEINLLRETRFSDVAAKLDELAANMFNQN
jgi:hypothetical protein